MRNGNRCAICGHEIQMLKNGRPEIAYRFPVLIAKLNYEGEHAHPSCIVQATNNVARAKALNLKPYYSEFDS